MPNFCFLLYHYSKCKDTAYYVFQIYRGPLLTPLCITQFNTALELLDKKPSNRVSEGELFCNSFKYYARTSVKQSAKGKEMPSLPAI